MKPFQPTTTLLLLICLVSAAACMSMVKLDVALESSEVQRVTRGAVLPDSDPAWRDRPANVIRFDLSSDENLIRYFDERHLGIQCHCNVIGAEDGRTYNGFAIGPLQEGVDISALGNRREDAGSLAPDSTGKYRYTVYAFLDLEADDEEFVDGKPRGTFDLSSRRFSGVSCYIIGVTKAPGIFPRTNAFSMSERQLKDGVANLAHAVEAQR